MDARGSEIEAKGRILSQDTHVRTRDRNDAEDGKKKGTGRGNPYASVCVCARICANEGCTLTQDTSIDRRPAWIPPLRIVHAPPLSQFQRKLNLRTKFLSSFEAIELFPETTGSPQIKKMKVYTCVCVCVCVDP